MKQVYYTFALQVGKHLVKAVSKTERVFLCQDLYRMLSLNMPLPSLPPTGGQNFLLSISSRC